MKGAANRSNKLLSVKRKAGSKDKHVFTPSKPNTNKSSEIKDNKSEKKHKKDKKFKKASSSKRLKGT